MANIQRAVGYLLMRAGQRPFGLAILRSASEPPQESANEAANAIRIIVADSEPIYRIGVRKIVAVEGDPDSPVSLIYQQMARTVGARIAQSGQIVAQSMPKIVITED